MDDNDKVPTGHPTNRPSVNMSGAARLRSTDNVHGRTAVAVLLAHEMLDLDRGILMVGDVIENVPIQVLGLTESNIENHMNKLAQNNGLLARVYVGDRSEYNGQTGYRVTEFLREEINRINNDDR